MTTTLKDAVRDALAKLCIAFDHKLDDPEASIDVYAEALRDLAPIDIERGAIRVIREEPRFFPKPAMLRQHAVEERTARTAWTAWLPPTDADAGDSHCPVCGATKFWGRVVEVPPPDPRYFTARAAARFPARTITRTEVLHRPGCKLRRADQPAYLTAL
jgi:hypothetical protein